MTINHIFVNVTKSKMPAMRAFYLKALKPVGYTELIPVSDSLVGYGSDYPYLWLRALPDNVQSIPIHIALDAPGTLTLSAFDQDLKFKKPGNQSTTSTALELRTEERVKDFLESVQR